MKKILTLIIAVILNSSCHALSLPDNVTLSLEVIPQETLQKFITYTNRYFDRERAMEFPDDIVRELAQEEIAENDLELWQLYALAHHLDYGVTAHICARQHLNKTQNLPLEQRLQAPFNLPSDVLRKHYFLMTKDASVMRYTNEDGNLVTLSMNLFEYIYGRRLEINNSVLEVNGFFLDDISGIEVCLDDPAAFAFDFSDNLLTKIPEGISCAQQVTSINFSGNKLTSLPEGLCQLKKLEKLDIRNNQITQLPKNMGNLTNLWRLDADNNDITSLPESISDLENLHWLSLRNNKLTELPNDLYKLDSLERLYVNNNNISHLPDNISWTQNLRVFDAHNNPLTQLPKDYKRLTRVPVLNLEPTPAPEVTSTNN
ncbi:leucine-rich repeat domain-containing protein [Candidatus Babeliales bacterium]|nr:leucine-rich repeat domain-containing protein [Candidatus Babeliales bacterium]